MHPVITRRQFLERASSATALLLTARAAEAADGMFVSLNGSLTPGVSGADKARLAAKLGYGGVDWDFGPARKAGPEETTALFKELKIKPTIVGLPLQQPFGGEDAEFKGRLPQLIEDAAFCQRDRLHQDDAGPLAGGGAPEGRAAQAGRRSPGGDLGDSPEVEYPSRARVSRSSIYADRSRAGRRTASALHLDAPRDGRARQRRRPEYRRRSSTSGIGITQVGRLQEIVATDRSRIVHIHLSDAQERPAEEVRDNQRLMPGEGVVNLVGFLQALKKIGYQDGVSPEPLGRIPKDMQPKKPQDSA